MNWNRQMEEMIGTWTSMQRQLWENWLQTVQDFGKDSNGEASHWPQGYQNNLEAWQRSVREALDAQMQWSRTWADRVDDDEAPEAVSRWALQVQEMMKGWTEAQHRLWNAWFESVKDLDPAEVAERWDSEGKQVLQAWQEAAERAQDAIADWSRMFEEQPKKK